MLWIDAHTMSYLSWVPISSLQAHIIVIWSREIAPMSLIAGRPKHIVLNSFAGSIIAIQIGQEK